MTSRLNMIVQALSVAMQIANYSVDLLPEYRFPITVGISAIQGTLGVLAHFVNPDGTSARAPWVKK